MNPPSVDDGSTKGFRSTIPATEPNSREFAANAAMAPCAIAALCPRIYEGASDIQLEIIARELKQG